VLILDQLCLLREHVTDHSRENTHPDHEEGHFDHDRGGNNDQKGFGSHVGEYTAVDLKV
jgi:hypothetical protein